MAALHQAHRGGEQEDDDAASALRARGNAAFARGDYVDAVDAYTRALGQRPETPELWSNRAACYLKLDQPCVVVGYLSAPTE